MDYSQLPWNFEAFRRFIDYRTMQKAASVICLFDGKNLVDNPKNLEEFQETLNDRTGLEWLPKREVSEDIQFNIEGNVFRNKARVLTSFYLFDPRSLEKGNTLKATPFCKALGAGKISEKEFYGTIITRFKYPHPAYDENWSSWKNANIELKPLVFILQILIALHKIDKNQDFISIKEFAEFAHSNPFHDKAQEIAKKIYNARVSKINISRERSDKIDRKIGDIFGFICMTGLCYYIDTGIRLNLIRKNQQENVYFYEQRNQENALEEIEALIS